MPPGAGIPLVLPQAQIKTVGSTSRDVYGPEVQQAQDELARIREQRVDIEKQRGQILQNVAQIEVDKRNQERAIQAKTAEEQEALKEETIGDIDEAKREYEESRDSYEGMEITDYMSSRSLGQRAMTAFGIALGELGVALAGGTNPALSKFNRAVDMDFRRQKENILKAKAEVNMAVTGIQDAEKAAERRLSDLQAKKEALRLRVIADAEAKIAATGPEQANLAAQMAVQNQRELIAQEVAEHAKTVGKRTVRRNILKRFEPTGLAPGARPIMSETTGKVADRAEKADDGFALRMVTQARVIKGMDGMSPEGVKTLERIARFEKIAGTEFLGGLRETLPMALGGGTLRERLNDHDTAVYNATQELASAGLRKESGAAIGVDETLKKLQSVTRMSGESDAEMERKFQIMDDQIMAIAGTSHRPSYWRQQLSQGGRPQAAPAAAPQAAPTAPTEPPPITPQAPAAQQPIPLRPQAAPAAPAAPRSQELQGAINWLRKNPRHPKAKAVRAKIRQLRGN